MKINTKDERVLLLLNTSLKDLLKAKCGVGVNKRLELRFEGTEWLVVINGYEVTITEEK